MNGPMQAPATREVRIPSGDAWLYGDLAVPPGHRGLVLFAHGSGSGRHSARNRQVAARLQQAGIATLLFDLLTAQEEQVDLHTREHRFDIPLLTRRMQDATAWAASQQGLEHAPDRLLRRQHRQRRGADRGGHGWASASPPSCRAAAGPTWPARLPWPPSRPRPC